MPMSSYRRFGRTASLAAVLLLAACGSRPGTMETPPPSVSATPSPSASLPPESPSPAGQENQKLVDTFIQQASADTAPDVLMQQLIRSVAAASPSEDDQMLRAMDAYYTRNLPELEKKFQAEDTARELSSLKLPVTKEQIDGLKDDKVRELARGAVEGGYKLDGAEGFIFPVVDYAALLALADGASPVVRDYLSLMAFESEDRMARDAAIGISREELAKRTLTAESYLIQYPDAPEREKVKTRFIFYLQAYLIGMDNTPNFGDNFQVRPDVKSDFEKMAAGHPGTVTGKMTGELLAILEKTGGALFHKDADGLQADIPEVKAFYQGIEKEALGALQSS